MDPDLLKRLPLLLGLTVAIGGALLVYITGKRGKRQDAERQAALVGVAAQLGMGFTPTDYGILPHFGGFAFHSYERMRYASNIMYGTFQGASGVLFDYYAQTGSDRSPSVVRLTVAAFDVSATPLPVLEIEGGREGRVMRAFDTVLGKDGIDFSDDPEFARAFQVVGSDTGAVSRVLGPETRALLLRRPDWQLRSNGGWLLMSWLKRRPTPAEYAAFAEEAVQAMRALTRAPT